MIGPGSAEIAGNRVPIQTSSAWNPLGFGARVQAAPASLNTIPPAVGGGSMMGGASTGVVTVGGYGTADNNEQVAQIAGDNPWSVQNSPVIFAVLGLIGSLVLLRVIFWRKEGGKKS